MHSQVALGHPDVERLQGVEACWSAGLEGRLAEDSRLGVVRSDERGRQEPPALAVAVPRAPVWERVSPVPLDSPGLWVEDGLAERSVVGCWLGCQGASRVMCLWGEPEQVSVWLRWALPELKGQRRLERGLTPLGGLTPLEPRARPRAWALVWAQRVRPLRECFVGSPAFVVLLDATRASAR